MPLILVCGALMTVVFVRSVDELLTPYGAMVAGKTLAFGALLGLASLNKWRYGPRILMGDGQAAAALGRTAMVEWGILAAVLIATAVMTALYAPEHLEGAFAPEHGSEPEHPPGE